MSHLLGKIASALPVPYNRPFTLGPLELALVPAGHMLGSAQSRIPRPDGRRIAYTGDLNLVPSLTAEPAQVAECDTLILESTFGHPRYAFPPKEGVLRRIEDWVRQTLDRGSAPVLFGYAMGKSQEVIKFLQGRGFGVAAHSSICELAGIYSDFGIALPQLRRFNGDVPRNEVLVVPPHLSPPPPIRKICPPPTAGFTG